MKSSKTPEVAEATMSGSTVATTAVPVSAACETTVGAEVQKEAGAKVSVAKMDNPIETWWSSVSRRHGIALVLSDNTQRYIQFEDYKYSVDTSTEEGKLVSAALRRCGRFGRDIFVVGEVAPGHQADSIQKQELYRKLRLAAYTSEGAVDPNGLAMVRALFTNKELIEHEIDPATKDIDRLILLAIDTKCLGS